MVQGRCGGGGSGRGAICRLISFQSILSSSANNVPEQLYETLLLLLLPQAPCLQHMSTFDKALLFPPTIFSCSGLWNEGANKLAFYVYLCVGVSEGGTHFTRHQVKQVREIERGKKKQRKKKERLSVSESRFFFWLPWLSCLCKTWPSFSHDRNTGDRINTILCSD